MATERTNTPAATARKPYAAPELIEHGDIHTLVHNLPGTGPDGGIGGDGTHS